WSGAGVAAAAHIDGDAPACDGWYLLLVIRGPPLLPMTVTSHGPPPPPLPPAALWAANRHNLWAE
ncbi:hypothetical protein JYU34_002084, partial [Plutella xylostella]